MLGKLIVQLMAVAAMAALAGPAAAEGPYASLFGGYEFKAGDKWTSGGLFGSGEIDIDSGSTFGGAVGYAFDRASFGRFRIEGEVSYAKADVEGVHGSGASGFPANGESRSIAGMANIFIELGDISAGKTRFAPYIGAGAGIASVKIDYAIDGAFIAIVPTPFPVAVNDSDVRFAWQAMAGVDAAVSEKVSVFVEGRYVGVPTVSVINPGFGDLETERNRIAAIAGLRIGF